MAWATSDVFRIWFQHQMDRTAAFNLDTDTFNAALYNNSITPDQDVATAALSSYNGAASQWVVANEVTGGVGQWDAGGEAIANPTVNAGTAGVVFWDGDNVASGATATIANAWGCLVYDTTAGGTANRGICFNYFGGANSVTNGTFTINWSANGIWRATL